MKEIFSEFSDVEFVMVYVREAHPGERLGPHQSMGEKKKAAQLVAPRYGEHRRVLVDNLAYDFPYLGFCFCSGFGFINDLGQFLRTGFILRIINETSMFIIVGVNLIVFSYSQRHASEEIVESYKPARPHGSNHV